MAHAPNEIVWQPEASDFLDGLVDQDIGYLNAQYSIERIIHHGLHAATSLPFVHEGQMFYFHRVPKMGPALKELDVFTTLDDKGRVFVEHITFAP